MRRPSTPYEMLSTGMGNGLNLVDAPDMLAEGESRELINFSFSGRGRIAPRKAMSALLTVPGEVVGIQQYPHGSYQVGGDPTEWFSGVAILTWVNGGVDLYLADEAGQNPQRMGSLVGWSQINSKPRLSMAVINRRLFVVDERGNHGLTFYDPGFLGGGGANQSKFHQPVFNFDPSYQPFKMLARVVGEYNNMLFAAGYGTEADANRPEILRFSYLGLQYDEYGRGDAGYFVQGSPTETRDREGNLDLFDYDDYFMVGERGNPIIAMASGIGRLVIATPSSAYTLFGYDRESFQLELLDNTKGCVSTSAMIPAHGLIYWWSPMGPVRYTGNRVEDLSYKILRDVAGMNRDPRGIVAGHSKEEREIRFYAGDRGFAFNYEKETWSRIKLPGSIYVWAAGRVSPFTTTSTGAVADKRPPEVPTNIQFLDLTQNSVTVTWQNGDLSPDTKTEVLLRKTGEDWPASPSRTLEGADNRVTFSTLVGGQGYDVRVQHVKYGMVSGAVTGSFTTPTSNPTPDPSQPPEESISPPSGLRAFDSPIIDGYSVITAVLVSWRPREVGIKTEVYRRTAGSFAEDLVHTAPEGEAHWHDGANQSPPLSPGGYYYRVRHITPDRRRVSAFSDWVFVTASNDPGDGIIRPEGASPHSLLPNDDWGEGQEIRHAAEGIQ